MANKLERLAKILIIVAVASLFFRRGLFYPALLQPFELLIISAFLITIIGLLKKGLPEKHHPCWLWLNFSLLFIMAFLLGTISSLFLYHPDFTTQLNLTKDFFVLGTALLAFLLILYYGEDQKFIHHSFRAFLTSLLLSPFIFSSNLRRIFVATDAGFIGFHTSRTLLGSLLIIPYAYLASLMIPQDGLRKRGVAWVGLILITALILWTSARSAYLAASAIALFLILAVLLRINAKKFSALVKMTGFSLITLILAYSLLPTLVKNSVVLRFFPQFSYLQNIPLEEEGLSLNQGLPLIGVLTDWGGANLTVSNTTLLKEVLKNPLPSLGGDERIKFWSQSVRLFFSHPMGLSSQFYNLNQATTIKNLAVGPHNTFLQVALSGGWLALILFLFLIAKVVLALKKSQNHSPVWLGLTAAGLGLLIILLVDDRLFAPWFWVLAGLALSYRPQV